MDSKQILKNLHAVLVYAKERFGNEFLNQEVILNNQFKDTFRKYMESKDKSIDYFEHTTVLTNRDGQQIYIANQWFARLFVVANILLVHNPYATIHP